MIVLALTLANAATNFPDTFTARLSGRQQSLDLLAAAARKCGYSNAVVSYGPENLKFIALEMPIKDANKGPWTCTIDWVFKHPELSIDFLGNAAR